MSKTNITVLGGSGFIGSHVARHFQGIGCDPYLPRKGDESIYQRPLGHVIYAIGLTADFRHRPLDTVEAHVCILLRLIQSGNFESLTYLSSARVYAGSEDTAEMAQLKINPNDAGDLYNISKLMGESLCLNCGRNGMKVVRLSNVVGLRDDTDLFIDQILDEGRRTGKVLFQTSMDSRKDYIFIDDATDLIARIALCQEDGIYNVASGEGVKNSEIARIMEREMGFEISVAPSAPAWNFTAIDISKVKARFGFSPRIFSGYLPTYLQSYRKKKGI